MTAVVLADTWRDAAACRGHADADWWFSGDPDDQAQAIAVCGRCPVTSECLLDAELRGETDGIRGGRIRGGRGPARRHTVADEPPVALPDWVDHGTNTAANSYSCKCPPCREVKAAAQRQTKARRKLERMAVAS